MKQNIGHNHSRLTMTILLCTAYTVFAAFPSAQSACNLKEAYACYTKKPACSRRGRLFASFEFPFWFFGIRICLYFFFTYTIEINWKSILWNRKSSRLLSEKDRLVIKTTLARLWSCARQRLIETDHISFLPTKRSRLPRKTTKRNDHNQMTEIGVAAETSEKTLKRKK